MINWVLVTTKTMREKYARENVARQGFGTFLPEFFDKDKKVRRPLFPSYLFVSINTRKQPGLASYARLESTYGVGRIVRPSPDCPASPVPKGLIKRLKERVGKNGVIDLPPKFRIGDAVRVNEGMFTDYEGIYDGMSDDERIFILLRFLGRTIRIQLSEAQAEAA